MENHVIQWNAPRENANGIKMTEIGTLPVAFKGLEFFFVDKRADKNATFMVRKPGSQETITVVLSKPVNDMYRAGDVSKLQLLSLPVYYGEDLVNKSGEKYNGYILGKPAGNWNNFDDVAGKAVAYTADELAGF
jgi:hypothetical protein